jgi:hypothetical protein
VQYDQDLQRLAFVSAVRWSDIDVVHLGRACGAQRRQRRSRCRESARATGCKHGQRADQHDRSQYRE